MYSVGWHLGGVSGADHDWRPSTHMRRSITLVQLPKCDLSGHSFTRKVLASITVAHSIVLGQELAPCRGLNPDQGCSLLSQKCSKASRPN